MNPTRLAILGVALLAGVGAFFMMMASKNDAPDGPVRIVEKVEEKSVRVIVADADFSRGDRLDIEKLRWVDWPEKFVSEAFITEASGAKIEEMGDAVARSQIVANEPLLHAKIVRAGDAGLMAAVLTPGMRAVTMRISPETAAGGFILPGDRVDILYSLTENDNEARTRTILESVKVLAINTVYQENPETPFIEGTNVTLELSPADAEYFLSARTSRGELSLALRSVFEPAEAVQSERRNDDVQVIRYGQS
ncbi:MAG: Flp pilus assembly protein CpaB [Pseudomonadota bacterium]